MEAPNIVDFTGRLNLTYRELAEKIGKTTGFVGQLASGASSVSYDTMLDLVRLGINANELFGEELGEIFKNRCYEEISAKTKNLQQEPSDFEKQVEIALVKMIKSGSVVLSVRG